jgi:AraC-like DNA-binding protein
MPMLPIPAFVALVLAYLAVRTVLSGGRPLLTAFLFAGAAQSLLVALANGYGLDPLRVVLPVSAATIPPLAWIAFRDAMVDRRSLPSALPHLAAPIFALFCRAFAPDTVDVVVSLLFAGYGGAILRRLHASADMPLARLGAGRLPTAIWRAVGWGLVASAVGDVLIAVAHATDRGEWTGWMIAVSSSLMLLLLGLLGSDPAAAGAEAPEPRSPQPDAAPPPRAPVAEDAEIVARLDAFLARERLHLDPDLTLARLARRLHLPEKRLSAAVNRATGGNVSRHVNAWRIRHACGLIEGGAGVTDAMLRSGFNTKSNFNREFRRVTGATPSQWPARADASAPSLTGPD